MPTEARSLFKQCLEAFVENVSDDALLKSTNLNLLMHTRSDNVRVRQFALACVEALWRSHGGKLIGTLPTYIQIICWKTKKKLLFLLQALLLRPLHSLQSVVKTKVT